MIKWIITNLKSAAAIAVALLLILNLGYTVLAAKKIGGLENEIATLEEKARANAEAVKAVNTARQNDAAAIGALQKGQTEFSGRLSRTLEGLGRVSNESREILDTAIPDDISRLLNSTGTTD